MKNLSLRIKALVLVGLIVFCVLGTSTLINIRYLKKQYLEALEWRSEALARNIIDVLLDRMKYAPVSRSMLSVLSVECTRLYEENRAFNVAAVAVIDDQQTFVAHNDKAMWYQPVRSPQLIAALQPRVRTTILDGDLYYTLIPIVLNETQDVGDVAIGVRRQVIDLKVRRMLLQSATLFAACMILACGLAWALINLMLIAPINRIVQRVRMVSEGNLSELPGEDLYRKDEIGTMTGDLTSMINLIRNALRETDHLTKAIEEGRLGIKGNEAEFPGTWRELVGGMNNVLNAFLTPFNMTAKHIDRISAGDIPDRIEEEYRGDFNKIKDNLNLLIDATETTTRIAENIADGNLTDEIEERSEHDRMMRALNRMIRMLNVMVNETNHMIQAVKEGKLDVRGDADVFQGGWRELVTGVNLLIEELGAAASEKAALGKEMELAKKIQTSLLPRLSDFSHPDLLITAAMLPAEQVGGDFYDISYDRAGNLWLAIGDVSGHGVTPGLIMMMAQTVHTTITTHIDCDARDLVVMTNEILYKNVRQRLHEDHFMTFTALKYLGNGRFQHAGAHLSMVVFRHASRACEIIGTKGIYLNFKKNIAQSITNSEFRLEAEDVLILYTDGFTEVQNADGELLDLDRFIDIIEKHAHLGIASMKEMIMADAIAWCDDKRLDDMTIVIVKRKQPTEEMEEAIP
jgi:serine phosphatase RsbU (regulator of sigma subunit)